MPSKGQIDWNRIRLIIERRNQGLLYREIGEELGISMQRVYQLHQMAITTWRARVRRMGLNPLKRGPRPSSLRLSLCVGCGKELEAAARSVDPEVKIPLDGAPPRE